MKKIIISVLVLLLVQNICFSRQVQNKGGNTNKMLEKYAKTLMFPIGEPNTAYAKYFIGQSYLAPVSTEQVKIYNVTFEPRCRNNWHVHHANRVEDKC